MGYLPERLASNRHNPFDQKGREVAVRIDNGKVPRLFTNDLTSPAEEIAALYQERWPIELFFKWVKQNPRISKSSAPRTRPIHCPRHGALLHVRALEFRPRLADCPSASGRARWVPVPAGRRQSMPVSDLLTWSPLLAAPFAGGVLAISIRQQRAHGLLASFTCAACGAPLGWRDFLPLPIAATARPGGCQCALPGERLQPALALAACTIAVWGVLAAEMPLLAWINCLLGWTLLALAWIDATSFVLPDVLTLPLVLAGLAVTLAITPDAAFWHALGAAAGYLALRGIALSYRVLRGREGLGGGDAKLLAAAGAWLGVGALPSLVLVAAVMALACTAAAAVAGRSVRATTAVPFGPFLAGAFWLLWLYGPAWGVS